VVVSTRVQRYSRRTQAFALAARMGFFSSPSLVLKSKTSSYELGMTADHECAGHNNEIVI